MMVSPDLAPDSASSYRARTGTPGRGLFLYLLIGLSFTVTGCNAQTSPGQGNGQTQTPPATPLAQPAYDIPPGWTTEPATSGLRLNRSYPEAADKRGKGMGTIQVFIPTDNAGFDANFQGIATALPELRAEDPSQETNGVTANGYRIRSESRCCTRIKGVSFQQRSVGITNGKKQIFFMFLMANLRGDNSDLADAEFTTLVRSVRFSTGDKPFGVYPRPGDGGLNGVYTNLDTGLRLNAFGGMDFYSDSRITVFDPSGLYATELPKNGETLAQFCRHSPGDCGLYSLKKGPGKIEMADVVNDFGVIEAETKSFARNGQNLKIGDVDHRLIPPLKAGTAFSGTWRYFFAQTGQTAFSSNSVAVERTLVLRPDGTFHRTGWAGASGSNDVGTGTSSVVTSSKRPLESGRYRLEGYTLHLTGADGRKEAMSIFLPDVGSDKLLIINGANYLKQ